MMSMPIIFGWLATAATAAGYGLYIYSTIRPGGTRPSRMTWFILAALSSLTAWSYFQLGASSTFGTALFCAIGSIAVALLSIKYGHGGWELIDKITLLGVLVTCAIWYITGSAFVALIAALIVDFLALLPTMGKILKLPETEEFFPWFVTVVGSALNILALDVTRSNEWTAEMAVYPVYMIFVNGSVLALIARPQILRRRTIHADFPDS